MENKKAILKEHNIRFFVVSHRLFADAQLNGHNTGIQFDDVTNMDVSQLYAWLGY